jgi:hypothetical protein
LRRAGIAYERDKGKRRMIHLSKAPVKTSQTSASRAGKDDRDVSDVLFPSLHDAPAEPVALQTGDGTTPGVLEL